MKDERPRLERLPDGSERYVRQVGEHRVTKEIVQLIGQHPDPHRKEPARYGHSATYFRCFDCGEERERLRQFPEDCDEKEEAK